MIRIKFGPRYGQEALHSWSTAFDRYGSACVSDLTINHTGYSYTVTP